MDITLESRKLYILSGPPGSGKSYFIHNNRLDDQCISSDVIRESVFGKQYEWVDEPVNAFTYAPYSGQDQRVWELMQTTLEMRMMEGLTTFVDSTNVDDRARSVFVRIAQKFHIPYEILIFNTDLDRIREQNVRRDRVVPDTAVLDMHSRWDTSSQYPFQIIRSDDHVTLRHPNQLNTAAIDAIGDIHGMYEPLMDMLSNMGYSVKVGPDGYHEISHPADRKLLFLGDTIDRGPKSLQVLDMVQDCVKQGHYAIMGNHEHKLMRMLTVHKNGRPLEQTTSSTLETFYGVLGRGDQYMEQVIRFIQTMPRYYTLNAGNEKLAFMHANVKSFDPERTPYNTIINGDRKVIKDNGVKTDTDHCYAMGYQNRSADMGNQYKVIRGHIPNTSINDVVFSLEAKQVHGGHLAALPVDRFILGGADRSSFEKNVITEKCRYNYKEVLRVRRSMLNGLQQLVQDKLVRVKKSEDGLLQIFKYSSKVFYDNLWDTSPLLVRARGLVLDMDGAIIQHPFDKVFNWKENNTGYLDVSPDKTVDVVDKLNGFYACVRRHPYRQNQWLVSTTGSLDSDFVKLADNVLSAHRKAIMPYLAQHDQTLMFEIVDPSDPHIIEYTSEQHGAWLIGAREWNADSKAVSEAVLNDIAKKIGLKRPSIQQMTFGEAVRLSREYHGEGFMIRDVDSGDFLCKLKSTYYLTKKFIGRMPESKIKMLFAAPKQFKKQLDEEFFFIVDALPTKMGASDYAAMSQVERVKVVGDIIDEYFHSDAQQPEPACTKKRKKATP